MILEDKNASFVIVENTNADPTKPWYAIDSLSEVRKNKKTIEDIAVREKLDPELVKY